MRTRATRSSRAPAGELNPVMRRRWGASGAPSSSCSYHKLWPMPLKMGRGYVPRRCSMPLDAMIQTRCDL